MAGSSQAPQVPVEVRGPVAEAPSGHAWPTFPITDNEAVAWHGAAFLILAAYQNRPGG